MVLCNTLACGCSAQPSKLARAPSVESIPYASNGSALHASLSAKSQNKQPQKRSKSVGTRLKERPQTTIGMDHFTDFLKSVVSMGGDNKQDSSKLPKVEVRRKPEVLEVPVTVYQNRFSDSVALPKSESEDTSSLSSSGTLYRSAIYLGPQARDPTSQADYAGIQARDSMSNVAERNVEPSASMISVKSLMSQQMVGTLSRSELEALYQTLDFTRDQKENHNVEKVGKPESTRTEWIPKEHSGYAGKKRKGGPFSFLNSSFLSLQGEVSGLSKKSSELKSKQGSTMSLQHDMRSHMISNVLLSSVHNSNLGHSKDLAAGGRSTQSLSKGKYPSVQSLLINGYGSQASINFPPTPLAVTAKNSDSYRDVKSSQVKLDKQCLRLDVDKKDKKYREVHPKFAPVPVQSLSCLNNREDDRIKKLHPESNLVWHRNARSNTTLILPNKFDGRSLDKPDPNLNNAWGPKTDWNATQRFNSSSTSFRKEDTSATEDLIETARESGYYSSLSPIAPHEHYNEEPVFTQTLRNKRALFQSEQSFPFIDENGESPILGHKYTSRYAAKSISELSPLSNGSGLARNPRYRSENKGPVSEHYELSLDSAGLGNSCKSELMAAENSSRVQSNDDYAITGSGLDAVLYIDEEDKRFVSDYSPGCVRKNRSSSRETAGSGRGLVQYDYSTDVSRYSDDKWAIESASTNDELIYQEDIIDGSLDRSSSHYSTLGADKDGIGQGNSGVNSLGEDGMPDATAVAAAATSGTASSWHTFSKSASITLSCVPGMDYMQAMDTPTLAFMAYYSFLPVLHDTCVSLKLVPKKFSQSDLNRVTVDKKPYSEWEEAILCQIDEPVDMHLSRKQRTVAMEYKDWLKANLEPVLAFVLWGSETNYRDNTKQWCAQHGSNFWNRASDRSRSAILSALTMDSSEDTCERLRKQASLCFHLIESFYFDRAYFFGERPSSVDAEVFGYLSPILFSHSLTDQTFRDILVQHTGLTSLITHIKDRIDLMEGSS